MEFLFELEWQSSFLASRRGHKIRLFSFLPLCWVIIMVTVHDWFLVCPDVLIFVRKGALHVGKVGSSLWSLVILILVPLSEDTDELMLFGIFVERIICLPLMRCSSIVGFFLCHFVSLAAFPSTPQYAFVLEEASSLQGEGWPPTHARDPHQHQLWYRGDKAAPGATNHPVTAARRRVLGFNCNTLLLAMFTSCQISNSLNI